MWFRVEPRSPKPVYQQVVDGVKEAVAKGLLPYGEKLPSVREMAAEMMLNPNTVAKAYRELEYEKVIEVIRGRGTYIASPGTVPDRLRRVANLSTAIKEMLIEAHHLQMSDAEFFQLVQEAMREWNRGIGDGMP